MKALVNAATAILGMGHPTVIRLLRVAPRPSRTLAPQTLGTYPRMLTDSPRNCHMDIGANHPHFALAIKHASWTYSIYLLPSYGNTSFE